MISLIQAPHQPAEDSRREARPLTLRTAKLIFGGLHATVVDCLVRDQTAAGARVETDIMTMVPEILSLQLADGRTLKVRRCWARGNAIGLEFLPDGA
jgi:ferric-dicitrate binding protein FerR (iron transport regulator)